MPLEEGRIWVDQLAADGADLLPLTPTAALNISSFFDGAPILLSMQHLRTFSSMVHHIGFEYFLIFEFEFIYYNGRLVISNNYYAFSFPRNAFTQGSFSRPTRWILSSHSNCWARRPSSPTPYALARFVVCFWPGPNKQIQRPGFPFISHRCAAAQLENIPFFPCGLTEKIHIFPCGLTEQFSIYETSHVFMKYFGVFVFRNVCIYPSTIRVHSPLSAYNRRLTVSLSSLLACLTTTQNEEDSTKKQNQGKQGPLESIIESALTTSTTNRRKSIFLLK